MLCANMCSVETCNQVGNCEFETRQGSAPCHFQVCFMTGDHKTSRKILRCGQTHTVVPNQSHRHPLGALSFIQKPNVASSPCHWCRLIPAGVVVIVKVEVKPAKNSRGQHSFDIGIPRGRPAQKITPHWQDLHDGVGGDTLPPLSILPICFTLAGKHLTEEARDRES